MSFFVGVIRWILWLIAGFILGLTDFMYRTMFSLFGLKVTDFEWIWDFEKVVMSALGLFVLCRIIVMLLKSWYDDEYMERISGASLLTRIFMIVFILTFLPVIVPVVSDFTASAIEMLPEAISLQNDTLPSDILINSSLVDFDSQLDASVETGLEEGQRLIEIVTLDTINDQIDGEYIYFRNTNNLLLTIFLGVMCLYCFVVVGIQVVQRLIGLMMKIVIAPYAVSGLINPGDNSTTTWFKLCVADYATAFFQITLIWIVMKLCSSLPDEYVGGLGQGLIFIGAIFSILVAPSGIAQIIGGDVGTQNGMMLMQHLNTVTAAMRMGGSAAMASGRAALYGASATAYGFGRFAGGRTLNPLKAMPASSSASPSFGGGTISETSTPYNTGGGYSGTMDSVSSYVGERGILNYSDGFVTRSESARGTHFNVSDLPKSVPGAMAKTLGRHIYERSAQRLYVRRADRKRMNAPMPARFSSGINDYKEAVKEVLK